MSDRCYVSTRKGLFTVDRRTSNWSISRAMFVGDNVTLTMHDPRNGNLLAALNHGHFGIKLHRSTDRAETWHGIAVPQYPPMPEGYTPKPHPFMGKPLEWSLKLIWGLTPGGVDQPGVVWCGTMPGGLFKSENNGESWELNRPLWDHPKRKQWGPNGAEWPGIHSICVDPRDSRHVSVGVSTGGVWITRDAGKSRSVLDPAPQWHLQVCRWRGVLDRNQRCEAFGFRIPCSRSSEGLQHRMVCPFPQRRKALPARRPRCRESNSRRRKNIRNASQRPAAGIRL